MAEKEPTYDEAQIAERLTRAARLVLRGRLDPPRLQDRRLADDADARQRDRLLRRGGVPPSRSRGDLGPRDGQADDAQRRRDHRQGFRARPPDRGGRRCGVRPRAARSRDAEQVRAERRPARRDAVRRPEALRPRPRRGACCSSPGGSPSRRCGACSRRWRRPSRTTSRCSGSRSPR